MSIDVMTIKYSSRETDDLRFPALALKFEDDVPALLTESIETVGYSAIVIEGHPYLLVKAQRETSGSAMTHRLIEVLSVWNQLHLGYFHSEDANRELDVQNEYSLPSSARCKLPANADKLRRIGRLRFDFERATLEERYEDAQQLKDEHDLLIIEVSGMIA